jgi:CRISPR system Cascade subunit CasA
VTTFNLLTDPLIPLRRASGSLFLGSVADILDTDDPPVAIVAPRADFHLGLMEFLVAVFATLDPANSDRSWLERFRRPATKRQLEEAIAAAIPYFELAGEGVTFMQELGDFGGKRVSAGALFIEGPGAISVENNTDVFTRRLRTQTLSRRSAALALYVHQNFAPSGGKGYRTSVRGGGPLTTLVNLQRIAGRQPTLFQQVWANVPKGEAAAADEYPRIFPWAVPTRTSADGRQTTPEDVNPLQMFWGMPRRVRLHLEENVDRIPCDLTGEIDTHVCRTVEVRDYGTNYTTWMHPLTPYRRIDPKSEEMYRVAAPADRFGFRHWPGAAFETPGASVKPAACVSTFVAERLPNLRREGVEFGIYAAGYAMDSAKVLGFVEGNMPALVEPDPAKRKAIGELLSHLVEATAYAEAILGIAIRKAVQREDAGDATPIEAAKRRLWDDLEGRFRILFEGITSDAALDPEARAKEWLGELRRAQLSIFDDVAPIDAFSTLNPAPIVEARRLLTLCLAGYAESGRKLYKLLGLAVPEGSKKKSGAKETA